MSDQPSVRMHTCLALICGGAQAALSYLSLSMLDRISHKPHIGLFVICNMRSYDWPAAMWMVMWMVTMNDPAQLMMYQRQKLVWQARIFRRSRFLNVAITVIMPEAD